MFAPRGRFIPGATAGLARKSHTSSVTVARYAGRFQRMFRGEILAGWLSRGVEAGFEWRAGGAADSPVEGAHVNQGDFHRRRAVVMFGEAQGLRVHRADRAEGDGDAVFQRVLIHGGVDRALDAAAAPFGMHEIAVTNGLAGAHDPGDAEVEFYDAARERDPAVAGGFG
jgi:hypothetical protein